MVLVLDLVNDNSPCVVAGVCLSAHPVRDHSLKLDSGYCVIDVVKADTLVGHTQEV